MVLLLHGLALLLGLSFGLAGVSGHSIHVAVRAPVVSPADGGGTMPGYVMPADGGGTMPGYVVPADGGGTMPGAGNGNGSGGG